MKTRDILHTTARPLLKVGSWDVGKTAYIIEEFDLNPYATINYISLNTKKKSGIENKEIVIAVFPDY